MKLCELKEIMYSTHTGIQMAVVWDTETCKDIESDCSVDYAVDKYGDKEVKRIQAYNNYIVISI